MRIAVDVMGGDHGCGVIVDGVLQALEEFQALQSAILVGRESEIEGALAGRSTSSDRVSICHAQEVLSMQDKAMDAVRRKKGCSISVGVDLLKHGKADAFLSPGNTGGVVTAATVKLRRLTGLERAGIATVLPAPKNDFVLLDAGANVDSKPLHLAHYAVMGNVYAREVLRITQPRVGLLSVGTEVVKVNDLTLEAYEMCKNLESHFIGND